MVESVFIVCLAWNIYFEANTESKLGQLAVAEVTLRRTRQRPKGETVCHEVFDGRSYSWTVLVDDPQVIDPKGWSDVVEVAKAAMETRTNFTKGADHYYADYIKPPWWAKYCEETIRIDSHIFLKNCKRGPK